MNEQCLSELVSYKTRVNEEENYLRQLDEGSNEFASVFQILTSADHIRYREAYVVELIDQGDDVRRSCSLLRMLPRAFHQFSRVDTTEQSCFCVGYLARQVLHRKIEELIVNGGV